jgi:hypothetical protein
MHHMQHPTAQIFQHKRRRILDMFNSPTITISCADAERLRIDHQLCAVRGIDLRQPAGNLHQLAMGREVLPEPRKVPIACCRRCQNGRIMVFALSQGCASLPQLG